MRKCTHCGHPMSEGFSVFDGDQYYCSDDCLHTYYTKAEYDLLYEFDEAVWSEEASGV